MEKPEDKDEKYRETVTLVLEKKRFEVNKQRLIRKSRYFAALLSSNYMECRQSEHVINYEIPLLPFQNFIEWIHVEKLLDFVENNRKIDYVLTLLELSVLFAVDELTDNIIEKVEQNYLLPKHVIDIWLFAQELSLTILQDLCLATCLDRFTELPHKSIYKLSKENFLKLVANVNVRCSHSYLEDVVCTWTQNHNDTVSKSLLCTKQPKISYGIVSSESFHVKNEIYLHCWDGNKFFELDAFKFPKDFPNHFPGRTITDAIMGMQITGRGCYLYFIGGEFVIGSGVHNTNIWRYSLITKKWLCCTTMPTMRRHMIAVFVGSKLLLVGGVGRYRLKLNSIDIYDVHADTWSQGAAMPITFTSVPEYYVFHQKLVIYSNLSYMHLYCLNKNAWSMLCFAQIEAFTASVPILPLKGSACYIDITKSNEVMFKCLMKLSYENRVNFTTCDGTYTSIQIVSRIVDGHNPCLMFLCGKTLVASQIDSNKFRSLLLNSSRRFFNMIKPADLHAQKA